MTLLAWTAGVLLFNLVWYGRYLSFPLVGEDGAANYSFLLEAVRYARPFAATFPIKWHEGLGQPNVFVTVTFDPFSWLMWLPINAARAFRVSYAIRATVCWLTTYLFVVRLLPRARGVALTAASLSMLVSFTLASWAGIATDAGIPVATHAAVFPGLLWLFLHASEGTKLVGGRDGLLALGLLAFLLMFPIGSTLGVATLIAFALSSALVERDRRRRCAWIAVGKFVVIGAVILFAPVVGVYRTWSAVAGVSAREVFAPELYSYGRDYVMPHLWHDVPLGVRIVVLLAMALLFLLPAWPRPIRAVGLTLGLVVAGAQGLALARANGIAAELLERLPRPSYFEYYLPVFYATAAAYVLHRWRHVLYARPGIHRWWPFKAAGLAGTSWLLVGVAALWWPLRDRTPVLPRWIAHRHWLIPAVAIGALFVGAVMTWSVWPKTIHPLFARTLVCRRGGVWCKDKPGRTIGASSTPITEFLASRVSLDPRFRGRAEFLLGPANLGTEPEVGLVVRDRNRNYLATGNGMLLHALPLRAIPVASSYEQALDALYYLFWTRYVNQDAQVFRRSINFTVLETLRPRALALAGVRYVVVKDDADRRRPDLAAAFRWGGYTVYEIPDANIGGYSPTRVVFARTLAEELSIMRADGFDPRRVAVVSESERADLGTVDLTPAAQPEVVIRRQTLIFTAGAAGRSLAVLPFRFSHCWRTRWSGTPGAIVRVDGALLGVVFDQSTRVTLAWSGGYGPLARCLVRDRELVPQVVGAASDLR